MPNQTNTPVIAQTTATSIRDLATLFTLITAYVAMTDPENPVGRIGLSVSFLLSLPITHGILPRLAIDTPEIQARLTTAHATKDGADTAWRELEAASELSQAGTVPATLDTEYKQITRSSALEMTESILQRHRHVYAGNTALFILAGIGDLLDELVPISEDTRATTSISAITLAGFCILMGYITGRYQLYQLNRLSNFSAQLDAFSFRATTARRDLVVYGTDLYDEFQEASETIRTDDIIEEQVLAVIRYHGDEHTRGTAMAKVGKLAGEIQEHFTTKIQTIERRMEQETRAGAGASAAAASAGAGAASPAPDALRQQSDEILEQIYAKVKLASVNRGQAATIQINLDPQSYLTATHGALADDDDDSSAAARTQRVIA